MTADEAREIRHRMADAFGNALVVVPAIDTGPCRVCLRRPTDAEQMILLAYRPLGGRGPYSEIGPIFIHAHDCAPYASDDRLTDMTGANASVVVRAYGGGSIVDAELADGAHADSTVRRFLDRKDVEVVHIRSSTYGCWTYSVTRC